MTGPVLVAGATGLLGRVIVRKLRAAGVPVRALARHPEKVPELASSGADVVAVDLLDLPKVTEACRGVSQIVSTANNNMGKGALSPLRIDLTAHQNLCAAARNTGVRRLLYMSFHGATPVLGVDIFRLKWHIGDAVRRSQVPYVLLQPTAFMDIWIDELIAGGIRKNGVTMLFGDGTAVANYISVNDVAEFTVRILARDDAVNEAIDLGGPSDISFNDLATLVEKRLGASGKRRHIPVAAMKLLGPLIKPFNETAARMMSLGHFAATESKPFPQWKAAADRFGVVPETVEAYIARLPVSANRSTS
jgi:NADH dehydrogenase